MCGITGYVGTREALPLALEQLRKLEYRGYDSAGVAMLRSASLEVVKNVGKIAALEPLLDGRGRTSRVAVAHTRWATHGRPSTDNAHPHADCHDHIAVVHNGIIENYLPLRERLEQAGHVFRSETDTEVLPHLIEEHLRSNPEGGLEAALAAALKEVRGSFAIAVISAHEPDRLLVARRDSPLIIGLGEGEHFLASDIPALLAHTRDVLILEDDDIGVLSPAGVALRKLDGSAVQRDPMRITWDAGAAEKDGHEHFMIKEIREQPRTVRNTMRGRITEEDQVDLSGELPLTPERWRAFDRIAMVSCGTAYYAGFAARHLFERLLRLPVELDLASEFRYRDPLLDERTLLVVISQSGETADTLAAVRMARRRGATVLGVVNVVGSSIARESDAVLYTWAGPEICVASTKAYTSQLVALDLLGLRIARERGTLDAPGTARLVAEMRRLPELVDRALATESAIQEMAAAIAGSDHCFYLGRGADYAVSLEGALKLKEISYIHAEALAAGEMKHGPLALVTDGTPVVCLVTQEALREKMLSNIKEVKARGATVIAIAREEDVETEKVVDHVARVPGTLPELMPVVAVVPLQLLAYHTARALGREIDQPRNLAKSVT
ncbi:MAG: glutamine--fructose-6-phosphate transaminase (isomerizing), partial [Armatimonadetes bacterium]|nr:glutamine--fructose-6-phosphate transaminase (isomerizing) [Armatimonadota bacterium]